MLKKAKDPSILDNYRGITVAQNMGKLFESVPLRRFTESFDQSSLQFGFTKGLSPIMSPLIVSEARAEVKMNTFEPLFLVTLDSRKVQPSLWSIVKDPYTGLTSKIKWMGKLSEHFDILQGVRQG